jgi:succinate dehydrogenase / fumarate reductase flavoprotein subunit
MYDTVKGSDGSAIRTRSNIWCATHGGDPRTRALGRAVFPHRGRQDLPAFVRRHDHRLRQGQAQRTCAAADRTGHAMLHAMYGQTLRHSAEFYIEYFAIDLIMDEESVCRGVVALKLDDGTLHRFRAQMLILATGGYGASTPPAPRHIAAPATARRWCCAQGFLQDVEFIQFHPTESTAPAASSPRARGRRCRDLVNSDGERFMERQHPSAKDLAPRATSFRAR